MSRTALVVAAALLLGACEAPVGTAPATRRVALGEPTDGFPDWSERAVLVWTNRARADPAADLADCTVCAEKACYGPVPPLAWNHNLGRAARFHSANLTLAGCALQHPSPCTLLSTIGTDYEPGPCSGAPSCACAGGSATCGSTGTAWSTRVSYFGTSPSAENIARGYTDPVRTFYLWLWEPDANPACGWRIDNGHRANILGGSNLLGVGRYSSTYTQDFGRGTVPTGLVAGVHYPQTGSSVAFRANWYAAAGPQSAMVSVEGTCHPLSLERGTATHGTYLASVSGLPTTCQRYVFHFTDAVGADVFYPSTGAYGIGCSSDWLDTRPAPCGPCTPDCTGQVCGDDGCGGSCGTCADGLACAAGACVCLGTLCDGACIDTSHDPLHCGGCDRPCDPGEQCVAGACVCSPDCAGKVCGDDGCGGICGLCATDRTCDATGQCVCATGTDCAGSCVDTLRDPTNCGECKNRCKGQTKFCVNGVCVGACTPDCSGRACGDDGCGGSCGSCPVTYSCDSAGQCVCAPGLSECGAVCADTRIDPTNCGSCGHRCAVGVPCVGGLCQVPDAAQPDTAQPDTAQPDTAQPDTAQPDTAQPDTARPDTAQPDTAQPDTARPDAAQPDAARPDAAQPDTAQPDTAQPDTARPDAAQPDAAQLDAAQADTAQPDAPQPDTAQLDAARPDATLPDAARPEAAQLDIARPDSAERDGMPGDVLRDDGGAVDSRTADVAMGDRATPADGAVRVDGHVVVADAALDAGPADALQRVDLSPAGCACRSQQPATPLVLLLGLGLLAARRRRG